MLLPEIVNLKKRFRRNKGPVSVFMIEVENLLEHANERRSSKLPAAHLIIEIKSAILTQRLAIFAKRIQEDFVSSRSTPINRVLVVSRVQHGMAEEFGRLDGFPRSAEFRNNGVPDKGTARSSMGR
jgi:hypothetical protein